MKPFAAAALLALLCGCAAHADPTVETVTIYAPDAAHFVRTIRYDARSRRIEIANVGEPPVYAAPRRPFPLPPVAALRWIAEHGGFNQPIQTTQASEIAGVRVTFAGAPELQTRFADAWDVNEPAALKTVQSWYGRALYSAAGIHRDWRDALTYTVRHGRVLSIRFTEPGRYTLTIDRNGDALIAAGRGKRVRFARGHVDRVALEPIYQAALALSPRAPVYAADDPPLHVKIVALHRTYTVVGSNAPGLEIFAARMDQLAHDVRWNRSVAL